MRIAWAVLLALAVSLPAPPARAESPAGAPAPPGTVTTGVQVPPEGERGKMQRTIADFVVNGGTKGDTFVIVKNGELFVPLATVQQFGVESLHPAVGLQYGGQDYVSLDALKPDITYLWDPNEHLITVTVAAAKLGDETIAFRNGRPGAIQYKHATSGFLNYDLHEAFAERTLTTSLALDGALAAGPGDVTATAGFTPAAGFSTSSLAYAILNPLRMTELQAGEIKEYGQSFVPGNLIGIAYARRFTLDPYVAIAPIPSLTTPITTPSTVSVYQDGRLIRSEQVNPGILSLADLPTRPGPNDTTVVIANASGKQTIALPFYGSSANLAAGLTDFQYIAAVDSDSHRRVGSAYYRLGFNDWVTAGADAVAATGYDRAGISTDLRTRLGAWHAALAESTSSLGRGGQYDLQYSYNGLKASFGAEIQAAGMKFSQGFPAAQAPGNPPPIATLSETVFASVAPVWRITPYVRWQRAVNAESNGSSLLLGGTAPVRGAVVSFSAGRQSPGGLQAAATVSVSLGRYSLSQSVDTASHGATLTAQSQRADSLGTTSLGIDEGSRRFSMSTNYDWSKGSYLLTAERGAGSFTADGDFAAAFGFVGKRFFTGGPITDGFALVRVPGLKGVDVSVGGRDIGRTDGNGEILVPGLVTGFGSVVKLNDSDLPLNLRFNVAQQTVSPIGRSGMIVEFPYTKLHALRGRVAFTVPGKTVVPLNAALTFERNGKQDGADMNETGGFYLEDLAPGSYRFHIDADNGQCDIPVTVPASDQTIASLGTLTCTPRANP
jgi:outer membrane usher protein